MGPQFWVPEPTLLPINSATHANLKPRHDSPHPCHRLPAHIQRGNECRVEDQTVACSQMSSGTQRFLLQLQRTQNLCQSDRCGTHKKKQTVGKLLLHEPPTTDTNILQHQLKDIRLQPNGNLQPHLIPVPQPTVPCAPPSVAPVRCHPKPLSPC